MHYYKCYDPLQYLYVFFMEKYDGMKEPKRLMIDLPTRRKTCHVKNSPNIEYPTELIILEKNGKVNTCAILHCSYIGATNSRRFC